MSASPDEITFDGEPLTESPWAAAPAEPAPVAIAPPRPAGGAVGQLRAQVVKAHRAALEAQRALLDSVMERPRAAPVQPRPGTGSLDGQLGLGALLDTVRQAAGNPSEGTLTFHGDLPLDSEPVRCTGGGGAASCRAGDRLVVELNGASAPDDRQVVPGRFKPLARTAKRSLSSGDVALLAAGRATEVFGAGHRQDAGNPSLRLPGGPGRSIERVDDIDRLGGLAGLGLVHASGRPGATNWPSVIDAAAQLLQIYLLYLGAHLVLADARFQPLPGRPVRFSQNSEFGELQELRYAVEIRELGLLDRPFAVADFTVYDGTRAVMTINDLGVRIAEKPGSPYRPGAGGIVPEFLGRSNPQGERAMLNELHMAHAAKGDLAVAMGPEFEIYRDGRAPYIPNGDFLFVDRMMDWTGERGRLAPGATMVTEYDSPADSWYYRDNGHPFLPYCVLMETSLQSAVLLGYYLGPTLAHPDEQFSIRNLDGHATVTEDIDLRDKTIRQHSTLLSSDEMTGAILQSFRYELSADGQTFYTGESLFGYFTEQALASQVGLDAGSYVAPWQDGGTAAPARRIDLREGADLSRLTGGDGPRLGSGQLQLLDWVDLIPGGGEHGAGYLRGHRRIDPDEWYFSCHFHRDPVMPGSLGVEAILQAMQLYTIETGLAAELDRPRFTQPAGVELKWKYRGQILRTDGEMDFDVHIKEVRREPGRILVTGDASLWKPGLRIYELQDLAIAVVSS